MPAPQVTGEKGLGALPEQRATVAQAWPCSTEQSSSAERSHPRPPSAHSPPPAGSALTCSQTCRLLEPRPPCPRPTATWLTRCPCGRPSCLAGKADPVRFGHPSHVCTHESGFKWKGTGLQSLPLFKGLAAYPPPLGGLCAPRKLSQTQKGPESWPDGKRPEEQ